MEKEKLKEKLLETNLFNDDENLEKYCELIYNNLTTEYIKYKTQKHHIIPKAYFKLKNIEVDGSKENLVNLLFKDHVLAHLYLSKAAIEGEFKNKMILAAKIFAGVKKYSDCDQLVKEDLNEIQEQYYKYKEAIIKEAMSKRKNNKLWKECELEFLKQSVYNIDKEKINWEEIAAKLNRTITSIQLKAYRLKLYIPDRKSWWKKDETNWLINNYNKYSIEECSKILSRCERSIIKKLVDLNLIKAPKLKFKKWKKEEILFLKNNIKKFGLNYCAKKLDRTENSVLCYIKTNLNKLDIKNFGECCYKWRWTETQKLWLKLNFKSRSLQECAEYLNKTENAVYKKIRKLKLNLEI